MSTWDWQVFCKDTIEQQVVDGCFGKGGDITYLDWLLSAWGWTLSVSALALALALVMGICVGVIRTLPHRGLALFGEAWTEVFRNIPVLVQVFLWYYVVPEFVPIVKQMPSYVLVACGLGFFTSARISEQVRAGIQSLPKGQSYAGLAMGLSLAQTYRYVLLPVALRIVIPPLTSEAMGIIKNSAVAFAVSIAEMIMFARQASEETSKGIEIYLAVTLLYFISSLAVFAIARIVEHQVRVPGFLGAKQ
ncbi:MAG: amino acid ABC transporter permease [Rhodoferax sp.]